jgi:hypothetical protein
VDAWRTYSDHHLALAIHALSLFVIGLRGPAITEPVT